jgi:hypothetical protein
VTAFADDLVDFVEAALLELVSDVLLHFVCARDLGNIVAGELGKVF